MPLTHLRGRRKRDRLTLNMDVIDSLDADLKDLPPELLPCADQAHSIVLDMLSFNGADTFDRTDLLTLGMGMAMMHQAMMAVPPSMWAHVYGIGWGAIKGRLELLEGATR